MLSVKTALLYTAASGVVVFLCRAFPFIFLAARNNPLAKQRLFVLVAEKFIPPAAMALLCVNSIVNPIRENPGLAFPVLAASSVTAILHIIFRNVFVSIVSGTVLYIVLIRLL